MKDTEMDKNSEQKEENKINELDERRKKIIEILIFIAIFIFSLIMLYYTPSLTVELGDFGSIVPLLLFLLSTMSFKWIPIFSIIGILLTIFKEKLGDMHKVFFIIVCLLTVVSVIILFVI